MDDFEDRQDVEEWLAGLDADALWYEAERLGIDLPERRDCERDIAAGATDAETVAALIRTLMRLELVDRYRLPPRIRVPWHSSH